MKTGKNVLQNWKSEKGFTLAESIISLMIAVTILSLIPLVIKGFNHINHSLSTEDSYEWNIFLIQLRREIRNSSSVDITGNKLILQVNGEKVTYESFGLLLRRRVHDTGHEVVLQKVRNAEFTMKANHINLVIQFTNNHQEIAGFTVFKPVMKEEPEVGGEIIEK